MDNALRAFIIGMTVYAGLMLLLGIGALIQVWLSHRKEKDDGRQGP